MLLRFKNYCNSTALIITLLVILGLTLRIVLISFYWPVTNGDEATMDLMALHIVQWGEMPIFFYGQYYMGAFQAYLASLFLHFLPASLFSIRLSILVLYPCLLVSLFHLTKLLYSKWFAVFIVFLFTLGSSAVIGSQIFTN